MASSLQKLGEYDPDSIPNCPNKRFGIVVSEYHDDITSKLLSGAVETFKNHEVTKENILITYAPGAYELPLCSAHLYHQHRLDAVLALGCVIKGETAHDQYINEAVAKGLMDLNLKHGVPFVFGLLTTNNHQQAQDRAGGQHGNKGIECAVTALKMVTLLGKRANQIKGFR